MSDCPLPYLIDSIPLSLHPQVGFNLEWLYIPLQSIFSLVLQREGEYGKGGITNLLNHVSLSPTVHTHILCFFEIG